MKCDVCGSEIVYDQDADNAHIHHDALECEFFPDVDYSYDDEDTDDQWKDLCHILTCSHTQVFHNNCCPKCNSIRVPV